MSNEAFLSLPDLASRALAGAVIWANDEAFAQRENLISAHAPRFDPGDFGHKGKVYDGWETRRRRPADGTAFDSAIVRLGVPGQIAGVVIDTSWFAGNYPPGAAVWGLTCDEPLAAAEIAALPAQRWVPLVPRTELVGDSVQTFAVAEQWSGSRITHVRLDIYPDGGVSRLRVHGRACPDPAFLTGTIDLAAVEHGGTIAQCSDRFYSSPENIIGLGRAANMGDGWENARRRGGGNDYVVVDLAGEGTVGHIEIDTSYFLFNAPGEIAVTGIGAGGETVIIPRTAVLPDARNRMLSAAPAEAFTQVRLDVFPDGGVSRLRVWGELSERARGALEDRWAGRG